MPTTNPLQFLAADSWRLLRGDALAVELAAANSLPEIKALYDVLAALHILAKRMRVALVDRNRLAEYRLRAARKAGAILARTVRRGGCCQGGRGGSAAPLPKGVSWNLSSRWQRLARIDDHELEAYLAGARSRRSEISMAAMLRWCGSKSGLGHPGPAGARPPVIALSDLLRYPTWARKNESSAGLLLDAAQRLLGPLEFVIADGQRPGRYRNAGVQGLEAVGSAWPDRVFVFAPQCAEPDRLVQRLEAEHERHRREVLAVLPPRVDQSWFEPLANLPCCMLRCRYAGSSASTGSWGVAVYVGARVRGFALVFQELGTTLLPFRIGRH